MKGMEARVLGVGLRAGADGGAPAAEEALAGALSLPAWGHLLDRYGNKSVMTFSLLLWQAQNFLWCFLTPDNRNLLYGMWIFGGATSAGFIPDGEVLGLQRNEFQQQGELPEVRAEAQPDVRRHARRVRG